MDRIPAATTLSKEDFIPPPTCISSSGTYLTRPDTMVRGPSASPTSICSTYRLSASGCRSQLTMRPTRMLRGATGQGRGGAAQLVVSCGDSSTGGATGQNWCSALQRQRSLEAKHQAARHQALCAPEKYRPPPMHHSLSHPQHTHSILVTSGTAAAAAGAAVRKAGGGRPVVMSAPCTLQPPLVQPCSARWPCCKARF